MRRRKLSPEQRAEALRTVDETELISVWHRIGYEGHKTVCEQCPVPAA